MRVLIVEDEPIVALEIESIILERLPSAEVVHVSSVCDALNAIDDAFALAFLDVDVTDGKTYSLALELRLREVPFVFVSGAECGDAPGELAKVGFITKPFAQTDISDVVETVARPAGRSR